MGSIGGMLGLDGGINGTGQTLTPGTNAGQLSTAYNNSQDAMAGQQGLLSALQQQNGLGNQSQVYNQLQGVANGTGPNPAQAQLAQATGANVQNQAALMAGQRGAGANVGLMARQAAQQGANTQQQAVGQGATLQANQSLNALSAAGNMANTQAGQQIGQVNQNANTALGEQSSLLGSNAAMNANSTSIANGMGQGQQALVGGLLSSASSAAGGASGGAQGGMVGYADGGGVAPAPAAPAQSSLKGSLDKYFANASNSLSSMGGDSAGSQALNQGANDFGTAVGKGLSNLFSPSMSATPVATTAGPDASSLGQPMPSAAPMAQDPSTMMGARGGNVGSKLKSGGSVPGKAKVRGNSYANDNVKALLSPGEVVIPRNVMQSQDPARGAAAFVQAVLAKKGMRHA